MADTGDRLQVVLEGYAEFLREKDLALRKHPPYLVRWVREFLHFARAHAGHTLEQTLDLLLAEVGGRVGVKLRQIRQAGDAVRIYRYQYSCAADGALHERDPGTVGCSGAGIPVNHPVDVNQRL